jgi:hypothetical protein
LNPSGSFGPPLHEPRPSRPITSAAALWAPLARFIAVEERLGRWAQRGPARAFAYEFVRFGVKQAWACLFGAAMVTLIVGTHLWYPRDAALTRYDFMFLAALAIQAAMLAFRLETLEEAKVILIFHIVGTTMEVFKTGVGSWIYPEPSIFRVAGVPLFSGFMYASVGSYIARVWRLFDFRFTRHPPLWTMRSTCATACSRPRLCCSAVRGFTTGSGMSIGACHCYSPASSMRCSSGSPKTLEQSPRPGFIRTKPPDGRWSRSASSVPGSSC